MKIMCYLHLYFGLITGLILSSPLYGVKYYCEWSGAEDWQTVREFSNTVLVGVNDHVGISSAIAMGFKVVVRGNGELVTANVDGPVNEFYNFVTPYTSHVVAGYFYDEPSLHASIYNIRYEDAGAAIKQFANLYKSEGERRGITHIPATLSYGGSGEPSLLGGVPDTMGMPGMFSYFAPSLPEVTDPQRAKYDAVVGNDLVNLKSMAGTRPIMLIGQSFDEGTGMPSAGQQQWYIDDVRNDPQIPLFLWFNYGETKKYPELITAHRTFGAQLVNIGVHNVSLVVTESSATVKWQTNLLCESGIVEYGATTSYGSTVPDVNPSSPDVHVAYITNLTPGQVIYYKITSKATGYTEGPYASWFGVGAGTLTGIIKDENSNPLSTVKVTLSPGNFYAISSSTGGYTINNIPPGNYKVVVQYLANRINSNTAIVHNSSTMLDFTVTLIPEFRNGDFETGDLTGWTVVEGLGQGDIRSAGDFSTPTHGGKYFLGKIVAKGNGTGRAFQKFKSVSGNLVTVNGYTFADAWEGTPESGGFPNDNYVRIGLDPKAGMNLYSPNVVWSEQGKSYQQWGMISVSTRAESNVMTIFIELVQTQNHAWNKTGIDDIVVQQSSPTPSIDTTPPPVPSLVAPINNYTATNPLLTFDWSDITDINNQSPPVTYELQVSTDMGFGVINHTTISSNSSSVINNLSSGLYYWRARAFDSATTVNYSNWSEIRTFIINLTGTTITKISELKSGEVRSVVSNPAKPGVVSPSQGESVRMYFKNKNTDSTGGEYKLRVLDVAGNIVYEDTKITTNTQDEFTWRPPKTLPPGVYITYIEGPGVKSYDKLIIGK